MQHFTKGTSWVQYTTKRGNESGKYNSFGGEWCANYYKILNPFWKAVFGKYIHFSNWSKKGINFVNDIIDNKGRTYGPYKS